MKSTLGFPKIIPFQKFCLGAFGANIFFKSSFYAAPTWEVNIPIKSLNDQPYVSVVECWIFLFFRLSRDLLLVVKLLLWIFQMFLLEHLIGGKRSKDLNLQITYA